MVTYLYEAREPHARRCGEDGIGRLEVDPLVLLAHLLHLVGVQVQGRVRVRVRVRVRARARARGRIR